MSSRQAGIGAALVLALLAYTPSVHAQEAAAPAETSRHVTYPGIAAAAEAAAIDDALVMVVFTAEWCGQCQLLKSRTLADPKFAESTGRLNIVHIDIDTDADTARQYKVNAIPDVVLMTADLKIIARQRGYVDTATMIQWVLDGYKRAAAGEWEGTELPAELTRGPRSRREFEPAALIERLAAREPAVRHEAAAALQAMRGEAVPHLLAAMADQYLGARVNAHEVLRRLAPQAPPFDPWASPADRAVQLKALEAWWATSPALASPGEAAALDPAEARSVEAALEALLADDALSRTQAMSVLVQMGQSALPKVRTAIAEASRSSDQKALWLLEDVRWAILLPDKVEVGVHARRELARGGSEGRQAATRRLSTVGAAALPALRELIDDSDPLVREAAVHALTEVGGADAIEAMATLLQARDGNLRMIAAQQLGRSGSRLAGPHLAAATRDEDELVACVAIAALEEVKALDQSAALIACLDDARWRVRAAAAEALGKMQVSDASDALMKLLNDPDPFVSKAALDALGKLQQTPSAERIVLLARRAPELAGTAVTQLARTGTPEALRSIESLFDDAAPAQQRAILDALAQSTNYNLQPDDHWRPLLDKAAASPEATVRVGLTSVLEGRTPKLAASFIEKLLADEDEVVRMQAARRVLTIAAHHWAVSGRARGEDYGALAVAAMNAADAADDAADAADDAADANDAASVTPDALEPEAVDAVPPAIIDTSGLGPAELEMLIELEAMIETGDAIEPLTPEAHRDRLAEIQRMHQTWHALLAPIAERNDHPVFQLAYYITGDPVAGLPVLERVLADQQFITLFEEGDALRAMALVLKRLPMPEGKDLLTRAMQQPDLYAAMLFAVEQSGTNLADYLRDPQHMLAAIEAADDAQLVKFATYFLQGGSDSQHIYNGRMLLSATDRAVYEKLAESSRPFVKTLALYLLSAHYQPDYEPLFTKALRHENANVRRAALLGFADHSQAELETLIAPLLADADPLVSMRAARMMLQPALRAAAGPDDSHYFKFDDVQIYRMTYSSGINTRPVRTYDRKPAFLSTARQQIERQPAAAPAMTLLLAQYGEFEVLDGQLQAWLDAGRPQPVPPALLFGLTLSRDPKYIVAVEAQLKVVADSYDARELLTLLRGVPGNEARELRRAINDKIRELQ